MNEDYIAKASVFFAFIGLTLMYVSSLYIIPDPVDVGDIEESWTGRNVQVSGELSSYSEGGGHLFMDLKDETGEIDLVKFESRKSFSEGERVAVQGHIDIYEGDLQIIAEEMETED